jgi:hypothetical protein
VNNFEPIFNLDCTECDRSPVVGVRTDEGNLQCSQLCGVCFWGDRSMDDWELWNIPREATE